MLRRGVILFVLLLVSADLSLAPARGQSTAAAPSGASTASPLPNPKTYAIPYDAPLGLHDRNGPLLQSDPLLDPPPTPPGWFAALQLNIVRPFVMQQLFGTVQIGTDTIDVQAPMAELRWTVAPELEIGYRLPEALGELSASYRFLATRGRGTVLGFDPAGEAATLSRLDAHITYLDYSSHEFSLGPLWDMKVHVGVCIPSIYFDTQARGPEREAHLSSYYLGAGPHLGFDFWRSLPLEGLELYARVNGVLTVGKVHQRFETTLGLPNAPQSGDSSVTRVRESPMAHCQLGLSYTPPIASGQLRFLTGYTLERWWYLAQTDDSRGELTVQGLFVRVEWRY